MADPSPTGSRGPAPVLRLRRPTEGDHAGIVRVVDDWWGGRRVRHLAARSWFRHFTGSSWVAETEDARTVGFLIGYLSMDDVATAVIHMLGVDPNLRRRGIGRALLARATDDAREHGARRQEAVSWPDDRGAIAFLRALGFQPDDGPGTMRLYGTPSHPHYEGDGEDRVRLSRDL